MSGTARTGGRILVDQLRVQGVDIVFGVPGESYLAVLDALHDTPEIRFVDLPPGRRRGDDGRGLGKLTGRPGICFVTRGPGATNASAGVHIAQQDSHADDPVHRPDRPRQRERDAFQEVDYRQMFGGMRQMGGRDRRRRAHPRIRPPRVRHRDGRPARAGGAGAARGHADRHAPTVADAPRRGAGRGRTRAPELLAELRAAARRGRAARS